MLLDIPSMVGSCSMLNSGSEKNTAMLKVVHVVKINIHLL